MSNKINPNDPLVGKLYSEFIEELQAEKYLGLSEEDALFVSLDYINPDMLEAVWDVLRAARNLTRLSKPYTRLVNFEYVKELHTSLRALMNNHPEVKAWLEGE